MSGSLILRDDSGLSAAVRFAELPEPDLKRLAATACRDRDTDTLIQIMTAYVRLRGRSGAHVSPHTIRSYSAAARALIAAWEHQSLMAPKRDAAAIWVRQMEAAGLTPGTVTVKLAGARTLYAALRWTGCTTADPFIDVRPARDTRAAHEKRDAYSDQEVDRLLAAADPMERVLVLLGAHAGMRNFELCKLTWTDIDLERRTLFTVGKGRKPATINLSRSLCTALLSIPRDGEYVLPFRSGEGARYWMRRLCAKAGVRSLGIHSLRHTAGTRLQREGNDISRTASHLRHSNISTTQVYVHRADESVKKSVGEW